MDLPQARQLLEDVRALYVERILIPEIGRLSAASAHPHAAEVKFANIDGLFKGMAATDWLENGPEMNVVAIEASGRFAFDRPAGFSFGGMAIRLFPFSWEAAYLAFDVERLDDPGFESWFDHWFDMDEKRLPFTGGVSGIIHSVIVDASGLSIDFGSAPTDSLWTLLELIGRAGVAKVDIGKSG